MRQQVYNAHENRMGGLLFVFVISYLVHLDSTNAYLSQNEDINQYEGSNLLDLLRTYVENNRENRRQTVNDMEPWTGRWMPDRPGDPTPPPKILPGDEFMHADDVTIPSHRVQMGRVSSDCDDAKTNLTLDWDRSPINHTCYEERIMPDFNIGPMLYSETVPMAYVAIHKCMNEGITYDDDVPTYGTHRPLWPVYGEYKFLPKQRWLHSLEHGAVVMLYHPCANPLETKHLKHLVKNCVWRHVISPYNLLDERRPLALLTWGSRLTMSYVNPMIVKRFIREKALRGPEKMSEDGDFQDGLLVKAEIISDQDDSILCPY